MLYKLAWSLLYPCDSTKTLQEPRFQLLSGKNNCFEKGGGHFFPRVAKDFCIYGDPVVENVAQY